MNKAEIYYFSGTGNSLVVARDIASELNAKLIPVTSVIARESINTDADVIGIVFPLYDFKPPLVVENFVGKIENIAAKYIFAICTYGITPSKSMRNFAKLLKSHGGNLAAGFGVCMPHNGIGSDLFSKTQHEVMFKNWEPKFGVIRDYIIAGKKGTFETSNLLASLLRSGLIIKMIPTLLKLLSQAIMKGWKSLAFIANEKCDGCGICQKICPVDNIEMVDNNPSWSGHCAGCFACFHWCPKEAIQTGNINLNIKKYHHPEVKIKDIVKRD